jgi:chemosensory pili system protein ChpA (sensor histidine kinase/response regulator)
MERMLEFDTGPLAWVRSEIYQSLATVGEAMDAIGAGTADRSAFANARAHLHQVHGALQMVDLEGPAFFAREVEQLAAKIERDQASPDPALPPLVKRAVAALGQYLDGLMLGEPNIPLKLFPAYREVAAARGIASPSESDLFFPDLNLAPPDTAHAPTLSVTGRFSLISAKRSEYQRALLAWLRNSDDLRSLQQMRDALLAVQRSDSGSPNHTFWWVATAFLESLMNRGLPFDFQVKQMCSRIDLQIRRVCEDLEPVSERVLRQLLYWIGRSRSSADRVREVKSLYRLDALMPEGAAAERSLSTLVPEQARELRELLGGMKEAWLKYSSGNASQVAQFTMVSERAAAAARAAGQRDLTALVDELHVVGQQLETRGQEPSEHLALEVATALLLAETALDEPTRSSADFQRQCRAMIDRLEDALAGVPADARSTTGVLLLADLARQAQERLLVAQIAHEVRSNLRHVEQVLDTFFRDPTKRDALGALDTDVKQVHGALKMLELDTAANLASELRGRVERLAAKPDGIERPEADMIAEAVSGLGLYMDAVQQGQADADAIIAPIVAKLSGGGAPLRPPVPAETPVERQRREVRAIYDRWRGQPDGARPNHELTQALQALRGEAAVNFDEQLATRATHALEALRKPAAATPAELDPYMQEVLDGLPGEGAKPPTAVTPAPASAQSVDPELTEIFLVEAGDVLHTIDAQRAILRARPAERDALVTVRRGFHTLKGSGRMVGLTNLGDAAWAVEQTLNQVLANDQLASEQILALIDYAHTAFTGWVGELERNAAHAIDPAPVIRAAEAARGIHEPPAAAPPKDAAAPTDAAAPMEAVAQAHDGHGSPASVAVAQPLEAANEPLASRDEAVASAHPEPAMPVAHPPAPMFDLDLPETGVPAATEFVGDALSLPDFDSPEFDPGAADRDASDRPVADHIPSFDLSVEPPSTGVPPTVSAPGEPQPVATPIAAEEAALERTQEIVHVGELELTPKFLEIFLQEANERLATLQQHLELHRNDESRPVAHAFMRAAHTLAGISATAGLLSPADLGHALERWLQFLIDHPRPLDAVGLDLMHGALDRLEEMVADVRDHRMPQPAPELVAELDALVDGLAAVTLMQTAPVATVTAGYREPEEPTDEATANEPSHRLPRPSPTYVKHPGDDIDLDLLPVFIEESAEIVPHLGAEIRAWRANPDDREAADALRRDLHTFKGGARMTGAMHLGAITHALENRVGELAQAGPPTAEQFEELESRVDELVSELAALSGRQPDTPLSMTQAILVSPPAAPVAGVETAVSVPSAESLPSASPTGQPATPLLPLASETGGGQPVLRVRADVVDRLANQAGEVAIARTRIEAEMAAMRQSMQDLTESMQRLRNQLREVEIQAESQIVSRETQNLQNKREFDPLELDRYNRLQELTRFMAESVNDLGTLQQHVIGSIDETESALRQQARMSRDLQQSLLSIRMVPFGNLSDRLYRLARQTARELGKQAELEIEGVRTELDRSVLEQMIAPLEHLLRNALSHGIEPPEERRREGKDPTGKIRLDARHSGNEIQITLTDDGHGLDLARIRKKGVESKLIEPNEEMSDAELMQLVFRPGFSTAEKLTAVSGRGVGLDVVRSALLAIGGRIDVDSQSGKGTTFSLSLPLTLAITQTLLVRSGDRFYALPSVIVEQVMQIKPEVLQAHYRAGEIDWGGQRYPFNYLQRMLGEAERPPEARRANALLLLRSGAQRAAIHVDEIVGNQEVVVKSVGPQLTRLTGVVGATVLANGAIALILNPVPLAHRSMRNLIARTAVQAPAAAPDTAPVVMVVDDSLTVRKVTGRLLQREGYQVSTAKDGADALEQITESIPDLILLDIEMPRMDGFELARHLRGDEKTARIPIVMITSRSAEKHRDYAREIGVDAYLGKPYQEDDLLALVAKLTRRAVALVH